MSYVPRSAKSTVIHDALWSGLVAGVVSGVAALVLSRMQNKRASPAMNAVSHIAWGGAPPADSGPALRNLAAGSLLHLGAAVFWATCFEGLFGRVARRRRSAAWLGAATTASAAYLVDYHVVPPRLRPGMEAFLDRRALMTVYAALAAGFALATRWPRAAKDPRASMPAASSAPTAQAKGAAAEPVRAIPPDPPAAQATRPP